MGGTRSARSRNGPFYFWNGSEPVALLRALSVQVGIWSASGAQCRTMAEMGLKRSDYVGSCRNRVRICWILSGRIGLRSEWVVPARTMVDVSDYGQNRSGWVKDGKPIFATDRPESQMVERGGHPSTMSEYVRIWSDSGRNGSDRVGIKRTWSGDVGTGRNMVAIGRFMVGISRTIVGMGRPKVAMGRNRSTWWQLVWTGGTMVGLDRNRSDYGRHGS